MEVKYSLSYYRKNNIFEPITEEQEGFFFLTEESRSQIRGLQQLIKDDVYGCYLISGMRGVGKTSFINVALSNFKNYPSGKECIIVKINAVQISDVKELFPLFVKELLHISENSGSLSEFCEELRIIDFINNGNMKVYFQGEEALEYREESLSSIAGEEQSGFDAEGIMELPLKLKSIISREGKKQINANNASNLKRTFEYERQEKSYELFRKLLNKIENFGFRLVLVIDEIDKCENTFMEKVFAEYKDMLTNNKLFCFFITDEGIYKGCLKLRDNLFSTYFIKKIYLPLMSYEDTMRYCFEHYCDEEISSVDMAYYISLGNTRLLNINYKTRFNVSFFKPECAVLLYKARLFQYIMQNIQYELDMEDIRNLKRDMLKSDIKALIEYIFDENGCKISEVIHYYNSIKTNRYPETKEILEYMKNYKDKLGMQIINFTDDEITICYDNKTYICASSNSLSVSYKNSGRIECNNKIDIKELFPFYEKGLRPHTNSFGEIRIIKLGDNDQDAYVNAMEHLLIANFYSIEKLIWIKRVREGGEWYSDEEYSVLAVIDTGIGKRYAYYNEAGSYSSEGSNNVTDLLKKMKDMGVDYSEKVYDKGERLDDIILHIIESIK